MYSHHLNTPSFEWNNVNPPTHSDKPSSRWGHSSCIVNNDLYIFGGFANSQYMNDLWIYSLNSMKWKQLVTQGDVPEKRSNATLNYDPVNNQLLLFGGGGPSKQRYNTVSSLDLATLNWIEIAPFETEAAPWQRTYHVAQFKYPYLIVFGGESADDLGDLWIYDVRNLSWEQAKIMDLKPCARRFHASCLFGSKMYIMGGCHGKYNCLGDIYCLDISKLLQTQKVNTLKWQNVQLKGKIVQRWGHSLDHYEGNLYIFGGRSNQDMNDLTSISLSSFQVNKVQTFNDPNARRRHSGGFIGSSLVLFGGFDGNYFEDLFYINLYQPTSSAKITQIQGQSLVGSPDQFIQDIDGQRYSIYASLLGKYFKDESKMLDFLKLVDRQYHKKELNIIFSTLYKGWGSLPLKPSHFHPMKVVPSEQNQTNTMLVNSFMQWPHLSFQESTQLSFVELQNYKYNQYMTMHEQHWQMDRCIILNNQYKFTCCSRLVILFSQYYKYLFNDKYHQKEQVHINLDQCEPQVFRIVLAYLHSNILVVPKQHDYHLFKQIAKLGQYFSLTKLIDICQEELTRMVTTHNCKDLLSFGNQYQMQKLQEICCLNHLNQFIKTSQHKQNLLLNSQQIKGFDKKSQKLYDLIKFDLLHRKQDQSRNQPKEQLLLEIKQNQNVPNTLVHKDSSKRKNIFGGN